jgi:hypothetical protein
VRVIRWTSEGHKGTSEGHLVDIMWVKKGGWTCKFSELRSPVNLVGSDAFQPFSVFNIAEKKFECLSGRLLVGYR